MNLPVTSRKTRDGTASTIRRALDFAEAARFLGGQPFVSSRSKLSRYQGSGSIDDT
jgi:hypothetical protein